MSCDLPYTTVSVFSNPDHARHKQTDQEMQTDQIERNVITSIQATDRFRGLGRIPVGFYAVVHHSGSEWRTESKPVSVKSDVVEWPGPIPIPSDPSSSVSLAIQASYEFQPLLGDGEQLRIFTVTVEQLLDHSAKELAFIFSEDGNDDRLPRLSILVTVERWRNDSSMLSVLSLHCFATDLQRQLEEATDRGHSALSRYRKHSEGRDLKHAIEQFQDALDSCPPDDPCHAAALSNLAMAKFLHCRAYESDARFEAPVTLYRSSLLGRPVGHPDRARTLIVLAAVLLARFKMRKDDGDAIGAEALLREAMSLSSGESHEHQAAILVVESHNGYKMVASQAGDQLSTQDSTLGLEIVDPSRLSELLLSHFRQFGDLATLNQAISILEASVKFYSPWDEQYVAGLSSLGVALGCRFDCLGDLGDLKEAISKQQDAVDRTSDGHPGKPGRLIKLCGSFLTRFKHLGHLSDLDDAISRRQDAVNLTPGDHPSKPARLSNLGNSFFTRFECLGQLNDVKEAVCRQRDAVDLTSNDHPLKAGFLNNLGNSLIARFKCLGQLSDLEEAISRQRDAVNLTPDGHPRKVLFLSNLGSSLIVRFEQLGEFSDLIAGTSRQREAVDLTPDDHPQKSGMLTNLGMSLKLCFEHLGQLSDIEEAMSRQRDAVDLTPDGHPDKHDRLNNLSDYFDALFERLGQLGDLDEAISRRRDAIGLTAGDHPDRPGRLNNLVTSLMARFERVGQLSDLDEAISAQQEAVRLTPNGHSEKSQLLNNLGSLFSTRFEHLGQPKDIENAISTHRDALDLTSDGRPEKSTILNNLCVSLITRFECFGQLSDLEEAISKQQDVVELTLDGHSDKPGRLNNLGSSFFMRFKHLGQPSDLEEAISRHQDAVDLAPDNHPQKAGFLNNFCNTLITRFERFGQLSDVEHAISMQQDAVNLVPDGHAGKPGYLNNLGSFLTTRFEHLEELGDLEKAISMQRDAVVLTLDGHPDKPGFLNNLSISFRNRFVRFGELSDLEEAISRQQDAVRLTPDDHPNKPGYRNDLGVSLLTRFERLGELSDLEQAVLSFSLAACSVAGPVSARFHASLQWISCSRRLGRHPLHEYSVSMLLLPQLAWIGFSLSHRFHELIQAADVTRGAAAAALDSGKPETAVEWLEQGRSIVWGEMFQLRNPYDELSSAYPDHARRLRELSFILEQASASREKFVFSSSEQASGAEHQKTKSLQKVADRHRALAIERDELLQEIRKLPGFERFLLSKEFSQLRAAALAGPVAILNVAETRCDALIVLADVDHVVHIPLPNFNLQRSIDLQTSLKSSVHRARATNDDREGKTKKQENSSQWESILATLWKCVVKVVLDALSLTTPGKLSRIFWCPTGPLTFLPIHAAGFYDMHHSQPGHKVYDFVVSSYIPTLSVLAFSPEHNLAPSHSDLKLLAVRQPPSDGLRRLPGVASELEHIRTVIRNAQSVGTTLVESLTGTVEEVLSLMKDADWVHFACHGVQDATNPAESGLCLADGRRLKLSDLISLSRSRGGLAFLSACQTAKGDEGLSDEAIHIAAGMLLAGYGGVVGTMWSINDTLAPDVARDVYEQLIRRGTRPDYREAARALHVAVGRLRDRDVLFDHWVPFIHVGL